ncbi:MAG: leucine--tRNA ligase [Candidatus Bathyarchaeota archaeon]|nr:leucine--tRNA ligase [Candidatus Bathyarchaeota archaeon]MDH5494797.1 leucine--tRNA ligase [Candidatus Bathyarchaeota archaeon]
MELLHQIEAKWQKAWEKTKVFEANPDPKRKKCFVTFPYSYANGPVHVGHAFTATRVDAYARFKRMQGYNVLFPWAWHWTGTTVAGASERVKMGDAKFVKVLREIDGVSEEDLKKFVDPVYMASYYTRENRNTVRRAGFSIDWRREFQTTSPQFSKFIEWQYKRLREKGYVVKGTHPVVWCPHCESPTGDHDRQEGEGVAPEEYTLMKFKYGDAYLPAATFRPETIYGVTNIWLNPEADYVEAEVNEEKWIISETAANKLKAQKRKVSIIRRFKGKRLIGKNVTSPIIEKQLPILPALFVNAEHATGVVYSVPAHAPVDWLALKDLQQNPISLKELGIEPATVKDIQPISMIHVEGFGEYPAVEVVDQLGVKDQCDPKAEEATKWLYKKEFHGGVLKRICGEYAGKTVREVKEVLINDLKEKNVADTMYDLTQPVICRCLTPCIVKILEGQWFLKYSDPEWKNKTKEALNRTTIYPETAIPWFLSTIDWLNDWPCARKSGLGTPLPWNKEWIIETLSDSTIYMAFYTINKQIKQHSIAPEQLTSEVFNYVFYGKGNLDAVANKLKLGNQILQQMRNEFLYWYPVDMRNSGKELIPNHLTFFLFQHTALFPPEHWPQMIGANGMLMIGGKPMSKSKGNFVTFRSVIEQFGADPSRCASLLGAEGIDDPDWKSENIRDVKNKLESFYRLAETIVTEAKDEKTGRLEDWLFSVLQQKIETVTESIEMLKTRTAAENAFFEIWNDFRWYARRKGNMKAKALLKALNIWVRLLAPFTPHICEEIWNKMDGENFVSLAEWPKYDKSKVNPTAEKSETLIKSTLDDTLSIVRATKIFPKKICYYTAARWKWEVYKGALVMSLEKESIIQSDLMMELMKNEEMKKMAKEIAKFASQIVDEINRTGGNRKEKLLLVGTLDEAAVLIEAVDFLKRELNAEVQVYVEDDKQRYDPKKRAQLAKPYRPAIYVE